MKVTIFGTGYVGLVAAVCFADAGNHVIGVDIDEKKISDLQKGIVPIFEPGLEELLKSVIARRTIEFTTDAVHAIKESRVIFIAVGTPEGEDGSADVSRVLEVAKTVAKNANEDKIIVLKSTVPVGTAAQVSDVVAGQSRFQCEVVSNPEFLKEGASLEDFLRPDRVVVGTSSEPVKKVMGKLYEPFVKNGNPILFMSNKSAELTKYAANAFLATKISFINELAQLADKVGTDINEVRKGFTSDSRICPAFFYPGVGYGGSCFPKDVKALIKIGEQNGVAMALVKATDEVNENQKTVITRKIKNHFGSLKGLKIAIWGLSFKPRTDDVREAPSFAIIDELLKQGAHPCAYDPVALENSKKHFGTKVEWFSESLGTVRGADALVIVTEWNEFRNPDLEVLKSTMRQPVIFDGRNIYDPSYVRSLGFTYYSVGRDLA